MFDFARMSNYFESLSTKRLYSVARIQRVNSLEKREKTIFFAKKDIHSLDFWGTFPEAFPGQLRERV